MISRISIAILVLLAGLAGGSPSFAAAEPHAAAQAKAQQAAKAKQMTLARQKAKQQAAARAKAKAAAEAKALAEKNKKDEWYAKDRDRGLDIASEYAPKTIAKLRKNNTIAKGDTVSTGNGHKGWRAYMDKYYSR